MHGYVSYYFCFIQFIKYMSNEPLLCPRHCFGEEGPLLGSLYSGVNLQGCVLICRDGQAGGGQGASAALQKSKQ